ncbi:hypothetical protein RU97_GL001423 [Enterococcus canis]|uniref:OsmC-like protein n=1 Tax=Enterococcus canis TaxID=214095 RepID=A0A1L8RGG5_9ENTE|nr:OsmC family protein [Enterococcus canis]OJG18805.1 hypothetical protein RU97_GL001423 [Enterococcus canis]
MKVQATAKFLGRGFQTQINTGHHTFLSDRMKQVGGTDLGADSLQLLLSAYAASLATSIVSVAKEKKVKIFELEVVTTGLLYPEYDELTSAAETNEIQYTVHLDCPLNDVEKNALIAEAQDKSSVRQVLARPTTFVHCELTNSPT